VNRASRRRFLSALAAAPLAARLPAWAAPSSNRLLVLVFLYGGNDNFNTWVPYADPLYYRMRPNIAVPRDAVIRMTDRQGFHPALAPLLPIWEARELAIVQGIGMPDATQQHYRDMEMAFTSCDEGEFPREGWVTRALARRARRDGLDAVAFDALDTREADPMGPFRGDKLGVVQVHDAQELLAQHRFADCSVETNAPGRERVRTAKRYEPPALRTQFPGDPFGQAVHAAVELAAVDRSLPVIHIALNGLDYDKHHSVDTHWDQLKYHGDALKRLADGLVALRAGLREIGRWDETLVATYDEFGRSPAENEARGTHHGHGSVHFVMGGRVRGDLYGEAPPVVRIHLVGGPAPTLDSRRLWTTVIERWWDADAAGIFTRRHASLDLLRA
jgi:uncharacterized protein (DUF1501 family)